MRSMFPCICPVRVVAMYALQSAGYIPASDCVRKYSKVDSEEAQALWKAAWNPKVITHTDSDRIFFVVTLYQGVGRDSSLLPMRNAAAWTPTFDPAWY